ncbi:hypothetical protein [Deinococcus aquaedulcis]|uniref:hypothetical protein n=1 Tax=Deinococcus aquaedulcis TaxID=2840455 RepID=UPI001C82ED5C|nr:hypothetical protein [Deinococcus aquaedulcis]
MTETARYTWARVPKGRAVIERVRLFEGGQPTRAVLPGEEVRAQFAVTGGTLVITQEDWFEGVGTWLSLVDPAGRVRGAVKPPDTFGFIQDLRVEAPDVLSFGFYDPEQPPRRWQVTVGTRRTWGRTVPTLRLCAVEPAGN